MITIGNMAKQLSCSVETLHYYEKIALIQPAHRSGGGHRYYNEEQAHHLKFIMGAKQLGFTLDEIADLIELGKSSKGCKPVLSLVDQHINSIEQKIVKLQRLQKSMQLLATECRTCCASDPTATACTILESLNN